MAEYIQKFVLDAQNSFSDLSTTKAIEYANVIHKRLVRELNLRQTTATINVTASTREYAISALAVEIQTVIWKESATSYWELEPTSITELNLEDPGWMLDLTEGSPTKYYLTPKPTGTTDAQYIGLIAIPDTTTSAGYPSIRVDFSDYTAFTVAGMASEAVPAAVFEPIIYADGIRWQHAKRMHPEKAEFFYLAMMESLQQCREFNTGMVENNPPTFTYAHMRGQRSV